MTLTAEDFEFVCRFVHKQAAIVVQAGKEYLVESRLSPLADQLDLPSISALLHELRSQGESSAIGELLVDAMTTNETSFLRDQNPFQALCETVLPAAIEQCRTPRTLRIWSAACSTGQEPVTVSILLQERFPELVRDGWKLEILATDISESVLQRAKAGVYSDSEIRRGLPEDLRDRYFDSTETGHWKVSDSVLARIQYRRLNLTEPWGPLGKFDVVFLRNVLIYFDNDTKIEIYRQLSDHLTPGGFLFLGSAERPTCEKQAFQKIEVPRSSCFQLAEPPAR